MESSGGVPQSGLRIDLSVSRKIDQSEQDIAEFPGESGALRSGLGQFPKFLPDFGRNSFFRVRPIKAAAGCPPLEVLGVKQGRETSGHPIQAAFSRGFFLLLELVPAPKDLRRIAQFFTAEDMGVPADEFLRQLPGDPLEIKSLPFPGELRMEKHVEEDIPQLLLQRMVISLINGFQKLINLLKDHRPQGAVGLFPIPRTSPGTPQPGHDSSQRVGFAHSLALRGSRRFVEPERDEFSEMVIIIP